MEETTLPLSAVERNMKLQRATQLKTFLDRRFWTARSID